MSRSIGPCTRRARRHDGGVAPNHRIKRTRSSHGAWVSNRLARRLCGALDGPGMVRAVRSLLQGLALRCLVSVLLSAAAVGAVMVPVPRWSWPLLEVIVWPALVVSSLFSRTSDAFPPFAPGELWPGVLTYALAAVPTYVALLYVPWAVRKFGVAVMRVTRSAARPPTLFALYFVAGGVLGSLAGYFLWSSSSFVVSDVAQLTFLLSGFVLVGWGAAVIRGAAFRHGVA